MNKIYKKNEVTFAIICIVIYVVGTSVAEAITQSVGITKLVPMFFHVLMTAAVLIWLAKNKLFEKYGLVKPGYKLYKAWFFLPLAVIALGSIFFGVTLKYSVSVTVFYMVSMICVGFLEELIFRGFLFLGMAKNNIKAAIIVSAVTFGIGHIVNLLNGQDFFETILQIIFAVAVGFTLVTLFYKGKSLIPCIVFHSVNNSLSAISDDEASADFFGGVQNQLIISVIIAIVICVIYSIYLWRSFKVEEE